MFFDFVWWLLPFPVLILYHILGWLSRGFAKFLCEFFVNPLSRLGVVGVVVKADNVAVNKVISTTVKADEVDFGGEFVQNTL